MPIFIFRAYRILTCEEAFNAVDKKWGDQQCTTICLFNYNHITGVGWVLKKEFLCFINLYTMQSELHTTQKIMVNILGVDALMKNYKVNLPICTVVIL